MSIRRRLGDLAKSLDSSSVGSFLSGDSADKFQTLQWTDVSGRPNVVDSATTTSIIDSAYVQARVTTYAVGLDSATGLAILDSNYMQSKVTNDVGFFIYNYDTTAGQTIMDSANEASNNAISYTKDYVMVFKNGVLLDSALGDYTAISGNTVVLGAGADSGELVTVVKWAPGSSSGSGGGGSGPWGDRALALLHTTANIDYFDITTLGNGANFGALTQGSYGGTSFSDGVYGLFCLGYGGTSATRIVDIEYVTVSTTSNSSDFGDLTVARSFLGSTASETYGLVSGGQNNSFVEQNVIDYVTIATPSNASDFGDLSSAGSYHKGLSDGTYGVFGGKNTDNISIDYVTIATPGNATDFGDMIDVGKEYGALANSTYGIFGAGDEGTRDTIQYITVATPSNATDFGDMSVGRKELDGAGNGTRGCFIGGNSSNNTIDYITIDTPGNASDFGDLSSGSSVYGACSGSPS